MDSSDPVSSGRRWQDVLVLALVFALFFGVYLQTILSFYSVFSTEGAGQSHAPLLLLVSCYLLYRAWSSDNQGLSLRVSYPAVVFVAAMSLIWLVASLVFIEAGQQASLILMAALLVISLLGMQSGRKYLMPILILVTAVPVWSVFTPYLQTMSAQAASLLLDMAGITSTREGYLLVIPNGTFEVADACSGLKFQIAGITLALIHTQLTKVPAHYAIFYVLAASVVALFSNVVRIFTVVVIGYFYGMDHHLVQDHNSIGWGIFSLFFFLFLYFGERQLQRHQINARPEVGGRGGRLTVPIRAFSVSITIVAFSLGPALYTHFSNTEDVKRTDLVGLDGTMNAWNYASDKLGDWKPIWTRGDQSLEGRFLSGTEEVDLFATQFHKQFQGHEAVNVSHRVYDIDKWSRISRSARVVRISDDMNMAVEETVLQSPGHKKRLVWQWYRTNNKNIPTNAQAKLNNLIGILRGQPDIAVYVISKEVIKNEEHASAVLSDFLRHYLPVVSGLS